MMRKLLAMLLLFAIFPFVSADLCNAEADLSVTYTYNQTAQTLTLVFEQSNVIDAFLIIFSEDLETVISEEIKGKSPVTKEYFLVADNYSLSINDLSNQKYQIQQNCDLEILELASALPKCEALNGKICSEDEVCSNAVTASDTDYCCTGSCEPRITQEDSEDIIINPIFGFIIIIIMVAVIAGIVVFAKKFAGSRQIDYEEPAKKPKVISEEEGDEPKYV